MEFMNQAYIGPGFESVERLFDGNQKKIYLFQQHNCMNFLSLTSRSKHRVRGADGTFLRLGGFKNREGDIFSK